MFAAEGKTFRPKFRFASKVGVRFRGGGDRYFRIWAAIIALLVLVSEEKSSFTNSMTIYYGIISYITIVFLIYLIINVTWKRIRAFSIISFILDVVAVSVIISYSLAVAAFLALLVLIVMGFSRAIPNGNTKTLAILIGLAVIGSWLRPPWLPPHSQVGILISGMVAMLLFVVAGLFVALVPARAVLNEDWEQDLANTLAFSGDRSVICVLEFLRNACAASTAVALVGRPHASMALYRLGDDLTMRSLSEEEGGELIKSLFTRPKAFLFNSDRQRMIGRRRWTGLYDDDYSVPSGFPEISGRGIGISFEAGGSRICAYALCPVRISHDMLLFAETLGAGMQRAFERLLLFENWRDRTLTEAKSALGRDMHDGVLQTLAGLRLRLSSAIGALGRSTGQQIKERLEDIQEIVATEQVSMRMLVEQGDRVPGNRVELFSYLSGIFCALSRQWNVTISENPPSALLDVSDETALECGFLLREAVANAVRHEMARALTMSLAQQDSWLFIALKVEGGGSWRAPDPADENIASQSLARRVARLGGSAYSEPTARGSLLSVRLPLERS